MTAPDHAHAGGGSQDPEAALTQLGRAITGAAAALTTMPDDEAAAYRCAKSLDAALGELAELLRAVPGIVGFGDPGRAVSTRLERSRTELATRRGEVAGYRAKLDELADGDEALADAAAEAGRLQERIGELERARRLAAEVPGLRIQAAALEEAVAAVGAADAPEISARIGAMAGQLAALTRQQREAVSAEADRLVASAEQAATELGEQHTRRDAAVADLARCEDQIAQLADEHVRVLPVLAAWCQADADLADGLREAGFAAGTSALEAVAAELGSIRRRLASMDADLQPLLAEQARAYEAARQVRRP